MKELEPDARRRLERYLDQVRAALRGARSVDPVDVEADVQAHIQSELAEAAAPVSLNALDAVPQVPGPDTRGVVDRGQPLLHGEVGRVRCALKRAPLHQPFAQDAGETLLEPEGTRHVQPCSGIPGAEQFTREPDEQHPGPGPFVQRSTRQLRQLQIPSGYALHPLQRGFDGATRTTDSRAHARPTEGPEEPATSLEERTDPTHRRREEGRIERRTLERGPE